MSDIPVPESIRSVLYQDVPGLGVYGVIEAMLTRRFNDDLNDVMSLASFSELNIVQYSESPIERLFFRSFMAYLAYHRPEGALFMPRSKDTIQTMDSWLREQAAGSEYEGAFASFDWLLIPQAKFPKINRRVDLFAWKPSDPRARIVVECDGFDYHATKDAFTRDRERDRQFASLGYRLVRFSGSEIYRTPWKVSADLFEIMFGFRP